MFFLRTPWPENAPFECKVSSRPGWFSSLFGEVLQLASLRPSSPHHRPPAAPRDARNLLADITHGYPRVVRYFGDVGKRVIRVFHAKVPLFSFTFFTFFSLFFTLPKITFFSSLFSLFSLFFRTLKKTHFKKTHFEKNALLKKRTLKKSTFFFKKKSTLKKGTFF